MILRDPYECVILYDCMYVTFYGVWGPSDTADADFHRSAQLHCQGTDNVIACSITFERVDGTDTRFVELS